MKTSVTFLLVVALILLPFRSSAPEIQPPPDKPPVVAIACVVLIVGGVVVYYLWKLCKKIPALNPPPPTTNAPPVTPPGTNTNHHSKASWVMPRVRLPDRDLDALAEWQVSTVAFQSSDDSLTWSNCLFVTNWFGPSNVICVAADQSGPVATNCLSVVPNQDTICDFGNLPALIPQGQRRFYRVVELD